MINWLNQKEANVLSSSVTTAQSSNFSSDKNLLKRHFRD